jgi:hypothetical protein
MFDRLLPPMADGPGVRGVWPAPIPKWTNIVDDGDVVALVKDLKPLFGERIRGFAVRNGSHAHDVRPYLAAPRPGRRSSPACAGEPRWAPAGCSWPPRSWSTRVRPTAILGALSMT